jgi:acyl-homoserine lactone acylase PvdQ
VQERSRQIRSWGAIVVTVVAITGIAGATTASAAKVPADPAGLALNILPSGQYGLPGARAADQARLYDGLTPLFDRVSPANLTQYFKSEALGTGTDGPVTQETVPYQGVRIERDKYNVPHVYADSYDGGIFAAGWIAAEDRGLLLQQARYNGRVAAIDAPGLSAIGLISSGGNFQPSAQTEAQLALQTKALQGAGKEGRAILRDIDTYVRGINAYLVQSGSSNALWTRNDVYAVNAVKSQFLGQGGGDEARRSQFLGGLRERLGKRKGTKVFNDLRQFKNPRSIVSVDGKFNYGRIPSKAKGSVVLDSGSFQRTPAARGTATTRQFEQPWNASNTLMVDAAHSTTGRPIMVGGPQISYFFPGLVLEIDMHAPGLNWRGATSAPFPGYLLIGRGRGFATTLTSASGDIIDQYAEKLCGDGQRSYLYKRKCLPMGQYDAGTLNGDPVQFLTTVHGPVVGYATVGGAPVAISSKRSSLNRDVLDLRFNRRLSTGKVKSAQDFFEAAALTPQTFNSFYIDSKVIAAYTSGLLPNRPPAVDPGLPTKGTGKYEWRGFLGAGKHPHGIGAEDGTIVNWNNGLARGFAAADNEWGRNGSVARNDMLTSNLRRLRNGQGKWSPSSITSAMNAAATQDIRAIDTVPMLAAVLKGSKAPTPQTQQMLSLLVAWRAHGGNRLDLAQDGKIDDPGAAIMDIAFPLIANNVMAPILQPQLEELNSLFRRFDQPPSGQYSGWYQYMDRDLRALLSKERIPDELNIAYCGKGKLGPCQQSIWAAFQAAAGQLTAAQGTSDPAAWRSSATAERIGFSPLGLLSMSYTNRPSGIQQVIWFKK